MEISPRHLSAGASLLMVLVWVVYLQLFLKEYKAKRQVNAFFTMENGYDLNALCVLTNMSERPVTISSVYAVYHSRDKGYEPGGLERAVEITDFGIQYSSPPNQAQDRREERAVYPYIAQGPLRDGDFLDLGSFKNLLARASAGAPRRDLVKSVSLPELPSQARLEIKAIVFYSLSKRPALISRDYLIIKRKKDWRVEPLDYQTKIYTGRKVNKLAWRWMNASMKNNGVLSMKN